MTLFLIGILHSYPFLANNRCPNSKNRAMEKEAVQPFPAIESLKGHGLGIFIMPLLVTIEKIRSLKTKLSHAQKLHQNSFPQPHRQILQKRCVTNKLFRFISKLDLKKCIFIP